MKKINQIANQIMVLEEKCQKDINISENLKKMEELMKDLSLEEILELNEILEKKFLTN